MGFQHGRPVAAVVIFRSCLHWKTLLADRTTLFDRIISTMGHQVELHQEDNASLSYWLSNAVTLFYLMQSNTKPASGGGSAGQRLKQGLFGTAGKAGLSFFSRSSYSLAASPGGEASIHGGAAGGFRQVEVKYPALLFKQQLDAFVQKIFPMLRDNVKKEITPHLQACIHAPRQAGTRAPRRTVSGSDQPSTPGTDRLLSGDCSGCAFGERAARF